MKKLRLDLSELRVESFDTVPDNGAPTRGTAHGHEMSEPPECSGDVGDFTCGGGCDWSWDGTCGAGGCGLLTQTDGEECETRNDECPGSYTYGPGVTCWDQCYFSDNSDCHCTNQQCTTEFCGTIN